MFIAIDAKSDIENSKKGKLTPAQHAQLNAWCMSGKTGILDWNGKCTYKSISVDSSTHTATILFNKGYVLICGRIIECEQDTSFIIDLPVSSGTTETTYIVLQYNLGASGSGEFSIAQRSNTRGTSPFTGALKQQDLNDNPLTGLYEFVLYTCNATPTTVALTRNENYISSIETKLQEINENFEAIVGTGIVGVGNPPLQEYDKTQGTIEKRIKVAYGTVNYEVLGSTVIQVNSLIKTGKRCCVNFFGYNSGISIIPLRSWSLPEEFRPKENTPIIVLYKNDSGLEATVVTLQPDGNFSDLLWTGYRTFMIINQCWEIGE